MYGPTPLQSDGFSLHRVLLTRWQQQYLADLQVDHEELQPWVSGVKACGGPTAPGVCTARGRGPALHSLVTSLSHFDSTLDEQSWPSENPTCGSDRRNLE